MTADQIENELGWERGVDYPEWGQGQVQSCIKDTVTINFQNAGKKTLRVEYEKFKLL